MLSLLPSYDIPDIKLFAGADKVAHICMYLGLSFLACWSYDISHKRMKFMYMLLAGVFMYGVMMEILQRTMHNGRNFDFRDMVANLTGTIIGLVVYRILDRQRPELSTENTDNKG